MQRARTCPTIEGAEDRCGGADEAVVIRRIAPDDFATARAFLHALSYGTRYFRYGRGDFVHPDDEIRAILSLDRATHEHLVAIRAIDGAAEIVGSGRFVVDAARSECTFSIVVVDRWQHHGVGRRLMAALMASARARGIATMRCETLGTNLRMAAFLERLGFRRVEDPAEGAIRQFVRSLEEPAA